MKKNMINTLILIVLIIGIISLVKLNAKPKYNSISAEDAKEIIVNEIDYIIIDTREKKEYKVKHIKDSINIPLNELEESITNNVKNKTEIIIMCGETDKDSKEASKIMLRLGYKYVYDLGDIDNWKYNLEN